MLFPKYLGNNNIKNSPITIDDINEIVKTVIAYPKLSAPKRYRAIGLAISNKGRCKANRHKVREPK